VPLHPRHMRNQSRLRGWLVPEVPGCGPYHDHYLLITSSHVILGTSNRHFPM